VAFAAGNAHQDEGSLHRWGAAQLGAAKIDIGSRVRACVVEHDVPPAEPQVSRRDPQVALRIVEHRLLAFELSFQYRLIASLRRQLALVLQQFCP
jgi:hypothetical protein